MMAGPLVQRLSDDCSFYAQLRRPGSKATGRSKLLALLYSRGLWLLLIHRVAHVSASNTAKPNLRSLKWWVARLFEGIGKYLATVCCKSEILEDCDFTGNVYLPNSGYLICGARKVGPGTLIHDHVTFGHAVANSKEGRPTIGANVWIGPDSIIAGPLTIGDGATILPGSYLTNSVPPRAVVKGNPARVVRGNFDNTALRSSLAVVHELPAPASHD